MNFYIQQITKVYYNQSNREELIYYFILKENTKPTYFISRNLGHFAVHVDIAVLETCYAVNETKIGNLDAVAIMLNSRLYIVPLFKWKGSYLDIILDPSTKILEGSETHQHVSYSSPKTNTNTLEGRLIINNLAECLNDRISSSSKYAKHDSLECLLDLVNVMYLHTLDNDSI